MSDRVAICTVAGGPPNWPYLKSVFALRTPGYKMFHHIVGKQGIDEGHNEMIRWFLQETDFEWMLHLDSDAVVHPDTLLRLLSWGKPFVSALAFQRVPPFVPVVYRTEADKPDYWRRPIEMVLDWMRDHPDIMEFGQPVVLDPRPDDALYEVDRGGAHCLLTHRSVLEAIPDPWYTRYNTKVLGAGSDFTFYRLAREAGVTTWLDRSVVAVHLASDLPISAMDFAVWNRAVTWIDGGRPAGIEVDLPETKTEEE